MPALAAAGYRVITWDCRGFGNSTFTSGVHGSEAAVADMAAVLDATGTPGAHLVGQSMGGWWVTAFTLAASGARAHAHTVEHDRRALDRRAVRALHVRYGAPRAAATKQRLGVHPALGPSFVERDPARAFLYQQLNTFHTPPMGEVIGALSARASSTRRSTQPACRSS